MEAIHNFRDFGGYETQTGECVRQGLLFRSGDLSRATDADLERLAALGIKTICDLRSDVERQQKPDRVLEIVSDGLVKTFTFVNVPMRPIVDYHARSLQRLLSVMFGRERRTNYVAESYKAYREYATSYLPQLKAFFRHIANPENLPVLIHCSAGKDRTGVVSGLIQRVLGVPFETVLDDYLKTNELLDAYTAEIYRQLRRLAYFGVPWKRMYLPLFDARTDYLQAAFDQVKDEFGAVDEWFRRGLGFSEKEQLTFQAVFRE